MEKIKTKRRQRGRMARIYTGWSGVEKELTCALFQLDIAAHMDVVYSDVTSGWMIKKSLKHHLNDGTKQRCVIKMFDCSVAQEHFSGDDT